MRYHNYKKTTILSLVTAFLVFYGMSGFTNTKHQPEKDPQPIVLLLVDTSASMNLTMDRNGRSATSDLSYADDDKNDFASKEGDYLPKCNSWMFGVLGTKFSSSIHYEYSRMMAVVQYILGDFRATRPWDPPMDSSHPERYRYLCGYRVFGSSDIPIPMVTRNRRNGSVVDRWSMVHDGLLDMIGYRARVGLMLMDNDGSSNDSYDYGPDNSDGSNYGFRKDCGSHFLHRGCSVFPPDHDLVTTMDFDRQIMKIADKLVTLMTSRHHKLLPHGGSPLGSMLADAYYYFKNEPNVKECTSAGQTDCDRYYDCRPKYVVLFTDGFNNIDDPSMFGKDGWAHKLWKELGVMVIVVMPEAGNDANNGTVYETDINMAFQDMGKVAYYGGSHWVAANAWGRGHRFIFGMPEMDPQVNTFYPGDVDGSDSSTYNGREANLRTLGRPFLANLLSSGAMVNHWNAKLCSKRRYLAPLAFTDETMPVTDLAGDSGYKDHYAGVLVGGFFQRGFKLAWQDQMDSGIATNLNNHRITLFGAPYDDGGVHLTFFSCKHPDNGEPTVERVVDTDSREWRYNNTDATNMKVYTTALYNGTALFKNLLDPNISLPSKPLAYSIGDADWFKPYYASFAFRPGDESTETAWVNEFGKFKYGLGGSWPSKLLNVHTGGMELRWMPHFDSSSSSILLDRKLRTLVSFIAGRPLSCVNDASQTNQDSDCGGSFGYVNTGWYPDGSQTDYLKLYNYSSDLWGATIDRNMLVRFGPAGHFPPVFAGHLQHYSAASPGFIWFKNHTMLEGGVSDRPTVMYTQTQDGILHAMAINTMSGNTPAQNHYRELWRYIPGLGSIQELKYFLLSGKIISDSPLTVAPVLFSKSSSQLGETAEDEGKRWHLVLIGGSGANQYEYPAIAIVNHGMYALDITDPLTPHLLWSFNIAKLCQGSLTSSNVTCHDNSNNKYNYNLMGGPTSKPAVGMVHLNASDKDVAVAVFGAGSYYLDTRGQEWWTGSGIFVVNLENGEKIAEISDRSFNRTSPNNIVNPCSSYSYKMEYPMSGGVRCFPSGPGKLIRQCLLSDQGGRLWLVDLSGGNPAAWKAYMIFDPYIGSSHPLGTYDSKRAYSVAPPILMQDFRGRLFALYGSTDLDDPGSFDKQHFVASVLVPQPAEIDPNSCPGSDNANWMHFFDQTTGEKPMGPMAVFNKVLYLTTYTPQATDGCVPGKAQIFAINAMKRGNPNGDWETVAALTDSNGDAVDHVSVNHTIPTGVALINLPRCIKGSNNDYYSTNLPDIPAYPYNSFATVNSGMSNPQVIVPLGSAGDNNKLGRVGENKKKQTKFLPAKVIKGGANGGSKVRVIPTSWSLIFD